GTPGLRALARPPRRPAPARHRFLHHERRHLGRVLPLRPAGRPVIRAAGLEKRYGFKRVLSGLDFELERGGFLVVTGPNGSGKTTLLRLCAGLAIPTAGTLEVEPDRSRIGYLGHEPLVYPELTVLENLDLYGRLYRVPERRERIGMLLERFGLWEARRERASALSRGQLQRLALCRALLHQPALLLLVLSVLAVFHFALPSGSSRLAAFGLLWVAIIFTALLGLGRAFVAEREQGLLDALVLAPVDRSTIWLAKGIATLAFLLVAEL